MDLNSATTAFTLIFGVLALIGAANLLDFSFRTMAEDKAARAEAARVAKWGLKSPRREPRPEPDEHLWHF